MEEKVVWQGRKKKKKKKANDYDDEVGRDKQGGYAGRIVEKLL